jgi:hypothetical protein
VIDAAPVIGMKARALLAMERAAGPHVALARLAFALVPDNVFAHHLRNGQALTDFVEELIGKAHAMLSKRWPPRSHPVAVDLSPASERHQASLLRW